MAADTEVLAPAMALDEVPGWWRLSVRAFRCWLTTYRRLWRASIYSSVLGPLFYLGAMGYGLGSLVDKHGTAALGGVPYVEFVAPAILAFQAMNAGISNAAFPVFGAVRWNRIYITARATGLRPADIYRGHLMFMAMRVAMNSACFIVVMAAFGTIRSAWAALLLPVATLTGLAFAAVVASWAVTLENVNPMNYVFRFGAVPMMLFSGTFFPVTRLPGWLQPVAYATPLWHGVALCRALSFGGPGLDAGSVAMHAGYLAAMTGVGLWAGSASYRRRLYV
jgi:lipooligosaccharide transport system permease protein